MSFYIFASDFFPCLTFPLNLCCECQSEPFCEYSMYSESSVFPHDIIYRFAYMRSQQYKRAYAWLKKGLELDPLRVEMLANFCAVHVYEDVTHP